MGKYWRIVQSTWQEYLAYRINFILEVSGGIIFTLTAMWLWLAVVSDRGGVGSYSTPELVTYLIGAGIITSFYFLTGQGDEINDDISQGSLTNILVRPLSPLGYWFVRDQTRKLLTLFIGLIGFAVVAVLYHSLVLGPASMGALVVALCFIVLAGVLHFFLYTLVAIFAFWVDQTWGERFLLRVVAELAAGLVIPLSLFPGTIQSAVQFLPFRFFAFVPMEAYLGRFSGSELMTEFFLAVVWVGILFGVVTVVMKKGLQSYSGEGI